MRNNEIKTELDEIIGWEINQRSNLKYETNKRIYELQQLKTIRTFCENVINGKITISEADEAEINL